MTTQAPASTSASTKDPKCNCPYVIHQSCDVKSLAVRVIRHTRADPSVQSKIGFSFAGDFEPLKDRPLKVGANHRRHGIPAGAIEKLGRTKAGLLNRYDIVIETTAQFAMGDKPPMNSVDIEVEVAWEGKCPTNEHGRLSMRTLSGPVGSKGSMVTGNKGGITVTVAPPPKMHGSELTIGQGVVWPLATTKLKLSEIYAQPCDFDLAKPNQPTLSTAIRLMRMGWAFLTPMDYEFTADTHGVLVPKTRVPNDSLIGLVRVYRETAFGLSIKFPPAVKTVDERVQRGTSIDTKKQTEIYALIGGAKVEHAGRPADYTVEEYKPFAYELMLKINDVELKLHERTTYEAADEAAKKKAALKSGARAAHDRAFMIAALWHCGCWVTAIKMVWEDVVNGLKFARKALASFWDWTKRCPQFGWKIEYEMTWLAGSFGIKFSQADGDAIAGRYMPLKWKGNFEVKLTVVEVKAKLSFGIVVDFGAVGSIDIRVFGEISGSVEAGLEKFFMNADPDDGDKTVKMAGTVTGRLGAIAAVESFIFTWKREVSIQAGMRLAGSIKWEKTQTSYEVALSSLPVTWHFGATNSRTKTTQTNDYQLCESQHIAGYRDVVKAS